MEIPRPWSRRWVLPAALLLALGMAGTWLLVRDPPRATRGAWATELHQPAPGLSGRTLDGGTLDLAELRGSVVVVHVWAAWCAPCREELPLLAALRREHPALRLVGIDTRDGERQARELLQLVGGDPGASVVDPDGRLAAMWDVAGVPETFLVDPAGVVRARHLGAVSQRWLQDAVVPHLAGG